MGTLDLLRQERLALVARLRDLPAEDWGRPSLCAGWTVRHVLAHLVTPFLVTRAQMAAYVVRHGGVSAAMDRTATRLAERDPSDLLDILETRADSAFHPPGLPLAAPLTDAVAHSADIRWALGDGHRDWAEPERLVPVLDFLVTTRACLGFVPPGRLRGLRLVADDQQWSSGPGVGATRAGTGADAEVAGPSLALALAALGRGAALPLVRGAGVAVLAERTGRGREREG